MKALKEGVRAGTAATSPMQPALRATSPLYNPDRTTRRGDDLDAGTATDRHPLADLVPYQGATNPLYGGNCFGTGGFQGKELLVAHWRGNRQTARQQHLAPARRSAPGYRKSTVLPHPRLPPDCVSLHRQYRLQSKQEADLAATIPTGEQFFFLD